MITVYDDERYLIDTTPAVALTKDIFESDFFTEKCRFPEEIVYELRDNQNYKYIQTHEIPISIGVLSFLQSTVLTGLDKSMKVLDLYKNNGNGDVFLIATVLDERHKESGRLFRTQWTIVTEDRGVVSMAKQYDIHTMNTDQFIEVARGRL